MQHLVLYISVTFLCIVLKIASVRFLYIVPKINSVTIENFWQEKLKWYFFNNFRIFQSGAKIICRIFSPHIWKYWYTYLCCCVVIYYNASRLFLYFLSFDNTFKLHFHYKMIHFVIKNGIISRVSHISNKMLTALK